MRKMTCMMFLKMTILGRPPSSSPYKSFKPGEYSTPKVKMPSDMAQYVTEMFINYVKDKIKIDDNTQFPL